MNWDRLNSWAHCVSAVCVFGQKVISCNSILQSNVQAHKVYGMIFQSLCCVPFLPRRRWFFNFIWNYLISWPFNKLPYIYDEWNLVIEMMCIDECVITRSRVKWWILCTLSSCIDIDTVCVLIVFRSCCVCVCLRVKTSSISVLIK